MKKTKLSTLATSIILASSIATPAMAQEQVFPLFGKEAAERGHVLPKTYGLSLSYMDMSNPINIDSIKITGGLGNLVDIDAKHADFKGSNVTLRGDMWLFPFMNVYALLGKTEGKSTAKLESVTVMGIPIHLPDDATFTLDMDGFTYGVGTTFAGGIKNWFAILDLNYSLTDMTAINGEVKTFVASPRVGYRWQLDKGSEFRLFVGAMYQDVDQHITGNIKDLGIDLGPIGADAGFDVKQSVEDKWNGLLGFQYSFNRDWEVTAEAGIGERTSAFVSLGRRF